MTRQANNIVSFDEAARAVGARRPVASSGRGAMRAGASLQRGAIYDEAAYRQDAARDRFRTRGSRTSAGRDFAESPRFSQASQAEEEQSFEAFFGKMNDRAQKAKRQAAKSRADREFTKRYGADHAANPADSGPRAAVYRAEMGNQHRKASRMQNEASARSGGVSFAAPRVGVLARFGKGMVGSLILAACCLLCCLFLYAPAQQYYLELRDRDRLAVEYAAVSERNEDIKNQVAYLSTPEGIQDRARQEFGWIAEGEYAVSVTGLDSQGNSADFQANINAASIKAPDTWYSDFLDAFFGYE